MKKAKKSARRKPVSVFKTVKAKPLSRAQKLKLLKQQQKTDKQKRRLDPFYINSDHIPKGRVYQWFSLLDEKTTEEAQEDGWKHVPFSRHNFNRRYNAKGKIVIGCTLLMENTAQHLSEYKEQEREKIQKQNDELVVGPMRRGEPFRLVSSGFVVSSAYERVPADAPPVIVSVAIRLRMSSGWQDAAAALGLTYQEYTRRRLIMQPILLSSDLVHENEKTEGVFEPVTLEIKKI